MTLDGTVDVPVVGKTPKKGVAVGVALVVGIVGYAWYRRTEGADGGGALDYYADTRTGSELPTDKYTNPAPNADGQSGTGIGGDSTWQAPKTNQEWAQQVIDKLTWYEPSAVSSAVGRYLSRQPVTDALSQSIIREAWAQVGRPPADVPLITSGSTPAPTPTPTPTPKPAPLVMKAPTGLKVTGKTRTSISLDWQPVSGAKGYRILVNGKQNGSSVLYSQGTARYLKPGTTYTLSVLGIFPGDKLGPAASIKAITNK